MRQGKVIRAAGGFFSVIDEEGDTYLCRARGNLKRDRQTIITGDRVCFEPATGSPGPPPPGGVIEKVLPRKNRLFRPVVANVDQVVVVASLRDPECDWQLVSRILVLAEKEGLSALVCLNKIDLAAAAELDRIGGRLDSYPYRVLYTSALDGSGLGALREFLCGPCSVLAGPSGAGKSSLLNAVQPGLALKTGAVSPKAGRGRHTTRGAELLLLEEEGQVVDTPGFSRVCLDDIEPRDLQGLFPEFDAYSGRCAFRDCLHLDEPECAVRGEAPAALNPMRYEHYRCFMLEITREGIH